MDTVRVVPQREVRDLDVSCRIHSHHVQGFEWMHKYEQATSPQRIHSTQSTSQTVLDYITSHPTLGPSNTNSSGSKIILYGQSLGGAVAIDLAMRNPQCISALIIENSFLSIVRSSTSSHACFMTNS